MPIHTQHFELDLGATIPNPIAGRAAIGVDADGALVSKTPAGLPVPVAFPKLAAHPATPTDKAFGYCLDVFGVDQFFVKTEDGVVYQITPPASGGGGALPFVIVTASQAAPAGFTYLVGAPGVVLTLAAGDADDRFAVLDLAGPVQIIADTVAPDGVQDDGGNPGATFTTPAVSPQTRTYQFAAFATVWVQTSREPYGAEEGALRLQQPDLVASGPVSYGGLYPVSAAGLTLALPDAPNVLASGRVAFRLTGAGFGPVLDAGSGSIISPVDGAGGSTFDFAAYPSGTYIELFQQNISGPVWTVIISTRPAYNPAVPADWAATPPTTMEQALDRIAAAVAGLLGTPIP